MLCFPKKKKKKTYVFRASINKLFKEIFYEKMKKWLIFLGVFYFIFHIKYPKNGLLIYAVNPCLFHFSTPKQMEG